MLPFNARWNAGIASPEEEQQGRGTDVGRQRGLLAIAIILHCVLVVVVVVFVWFVFVRNATFIDLN